MTDVTELCPSLAALGLTPYAARVFLALVTTGQAPAATVAEEAGVPRQRVYDVLEDLARRGLVTRAPHKPAALYDVVDPDRALTLIMERNRAEFERQEVLAREIAAELGPLWRGSHRRTSAQEAAVDDDALVSMAPEDEWRTLTRHSVRATSTPPYDGLTDPAWLRQVEQLTARGGSVRCVYQQDVLEDEELLHHAHRFADAGEQARVAEHVPSRMILTDSRRAFLPIPYTQARQGTEGTPTVFLVEHPDVVKRLEDEFELLWLRAVPLAEARPRPRLRAAPGPRPAG
ncbi:TrmB family transcriptional regulator [Streptacidiphilus monticola]|uniref:TrmB family transcriptional regulator n=1 Tax=Streptacidiphilus monticola TaxID=2161674 RepID=A0ABW1FVL0_9ACTN